MNEKNIEEDKYEFFDKLQPYCEPPFESPIEEIFIRNYLKHANPAINIEKQYKIQTYLKTFRVDFLISIDMKT